MGVVRDRNSEELASSAGREVCISSSREDPSDESESLREVVAPWRAMKVG
jgi:hypothetical protein